jgi:predicted CXXCH cytochrome family protein
MRRLQLLLAAGLLFTSAAKAQNYTGAGTTFPGCGTNGCHNVAGRDQFTTWQGTGHSVSYDSVAFIQQNPECLPCHSTGWDTTLANGGFDDFFPPVSPEDSSGIERMKNVQCEACHGPVEFAVNHPPEDLALQAALCGTCHQGEHHPTLEDWSLSKHAVSKNTSIPGFEWISSNPTCAGCHTAEGFLQFVNDTSWVPNVIPPGPDGSDLTCAGCHDPHSAGNEAQLRLPLTEICQKCHNPEYDPGGSPPVGEDVHHSTAFMFEGTGGYEFPGYDYPSSLHTLAVTDKCVTCHVYGTPWEPGFPAYTGHEFTPQGGVCINCHVDFDTTAHSFDYRGIQSEIDSLLEVLDSELAAASSEDSLTDLFLQAKFNHDFVEADGSHGIHNTAYARALLESAINEFTPTLGVELTDRTVPKEFSLGQNYPNPFNPATSIRVSVPVKQAVRVEIFDLIGQSVRVLVNGDLGPGQYHVRWDGKDHHGTSVPSGIYLYVMQSRSFESTKKMVLLR